MYQPTMKARMTELEQQKAEIAARLAVDEPKLLDVNPNIAEIYRRKVERLTDALADPQTNLEAATAIRSLIGDIVLTPGAKRGEVHATLRGELMSILNFAAGRNATGTTATRVITNAVARPLPSSWSANFHAAHVVHRFSTGVIAFAPEAAVVIEIRRTSLVLDAGGALSVVFDQRQRPFTGDRRRPSISLPCHRFWTESSAQSLEIPRFQSSILHRRSVEGAKRVIDFGHETRIVSDFLRPSSFLDAHAHRSLRPHRGSRPRRPAPHTESHILGGRRRTEVTDHRVVETYSRQYTHAGGLRDPPAYSPSVTNRSTLASSTPPSNTPTARSWSARGSKTNPPAPSHGAPGFSTSISPAIGLICPMQSPGTYYDVLDPKRHFVAASRPSKRHRIRDNFLGAPGFTPIVRRTKNA